MATVRAAFPFIEVFIDTSQLAPVTWENRPLVFINGCETAGFAPDALSPFIVKFVEDFGAAGVIGTEVPVWEPLARELAELFLPLFLGGMPAADALLAARRALWARHNPLGLVYTLYGPADLTLRMSS